MPVPGEIRSMPAEGHTKIFPREDNAYEKYESIPFDESQSQIWVERPEEESEEFKEWLAMLLIGVVVGSAGFLIEEIDEFLNEHTK